MATGSSSRAIRSWIALGCPSSSVPQSRAAAGGRSMDASPITGSRGSPGKAAGWHSARPRWPPSESPPSCSEYGGTVADDEVTGGVFRIEYCVFDEVVDRLRPVGEANRGTEQARLPPPTYSV